jgi:hypothetical protein
MADYGMLFSLILVALTFVIVGMCFIVYIMIIGEREKRMKAEGIAPPQDASASAECPHQFGYLSGYPMDQPIPEECFGCVNAIQCMNHETLPVEAQVAESAAEQED